MRRWVIVIVMLGLATLACNLAGEPGSPPPASVTPLPAPTSALQLSVTPTPVVVAVTRAVTVTPAAILNLPTLTPTPVCLLRADWPLVTVQAGDSLSALAAANAASVEALAAANCLDPAAVLAPGQTLHVPAAPGVSLASPQPSATSVCVQEFYFGVAEEGCPGGPPVSTQAAFQLFEGGLMIWRADRDEIVVLFGNGDVMLYPAGQVQELAENPVRDAPPAGRHRPVSGFGRVWGAYAGVRAALGWPLAPERGGTLTSQPIGPEIAPDNVLGYLATPYDRPLYYLTLPDGRVARVGLHAWWVVE